MHYGTRTYLQGFRCMQCGIVGPPRVLSALGRWQIKLRDIRKQNTRFFAVVHFDAHVSY